MKRKLMITLLTVIAIFSVLAAEVFAADFSDVPQSHQNYNAILYLVENGIASGYDDGLFKPEKEITRTEFCALISRALGYDKDKYTAASVPFSDVSGSYWGISYISYCYEHGLINGMGDGSFAPVEKVTAEQAIKMLVCASEKRNDVSAANGAWYTGYLSAAEKNGMLGGTQYKIGAPANRAAVAQMIYNTAKAGLLAKNLPTVEPSEKPSAPTVPARDYSQIKTITIDAGHNYDGMDKGAHTADGSVHEEEITWRVADKLRVLLESKGYKVLMTRSELTSSIANSSTVDSLQARVDMANSSDSDLFISVHCNMGGGRGTETYCFSKGGYAERLAKLVQKHIKEKVGTYDRGVKTANFYVIKNTAMPAILIETGFLDNAGDLAVLNSEDGQQKYAEAICDAVCEYASLGAM